MDPMLICKKTRRLKGKMADICRKEPSLLKEIAKGVQVGTKECQYQFRNRRWNCTTMRRSLRKILLRGKSIDIFLSSRKIKVEEGRYTRTKADYTLPFRPAFPRFVTIKRR